MSRHDQVKAALGIAVFVATWWILTTTVLGGAPRIYPSPSDVAPELARVLSNDGPIGSPFAHAGATMVRVLVAFSVAYVLGTIFGLLAGRLPDVYNFSTSLVWIAFSVPSVVWIFVFLLVFGISNTVPILALIVFLMAPVVLGTAEATRALPDDLDEMAQSYRASWGQRVFGLFLPSILPYMIANARVAFAFGMKIVLIAEVVGLPDGIGLVVRYWSDKLFMAPVIAWGIIVVFIGFAIDTLFFRPIERMAARWSGQDVNATARIAE